MKRLSTVFAMCMLCALTLNARAQDESFVSRFKEVQQHYNSYTEGNKLDLSKIKNIPQELQELANKASALDALVSEIKQKKPQLDNLDYESKNAESRANALQTQLENQGESDKQRVNQLLAQQSAICSQMGGAVQGQQCVFSCPQDNMAPCQSKLNQFNAQVAQILAQIKSIAQSLQELSDRVDEAQRTASAKASALKNVQDAIDADEEKRNKQEPTFNTLLEQTRNDIENAVKTGGKVPTELNGPAAKQLTGIAEQPNTKRGNEVHSQFDDFSHSGGAIKIGEKDVPAANPKATEKSPQYKTAYEQKKAEYDKSVSEAANAQKAFQDAAAKGASKETLSQLYKALTQKQSAVVYKQYEVNMLTGSQPKPADTITGVAQ